LFRRRRLGGVIRGVAEMIDQLVATDATQVFFAERPKAALASGS
jgi:hypothetical protein